MDRCSWTGDAGCDEFLGAGLPVKRIQTAFAPPAKSLLTQTATTLWAP